MSDEPEIRALVDTFFAAFASGPGLDDRMAALRACFVDGAVVTRTLDEEPQLLTVDEFIAPRHELLSGTRVTDFREWEVSGHTETFRAVAHHWCTYSKTWTEHGHPHHGHGAKTLQLVNTAEGWKITALAWDDGPTT